MLSTSKRWMLVILSAIFPAIAPALAICFKFGLINLTVLQASCIVISIMTLAFLINYLSLIKPVRDIDRAFDAALDLIGENLRQIARKDHVKVRLNAMLVCRPVCGRFQRHLKIVWSLGMDSQPDIRVCFPVGKGVAGEAFISKQLRIVNFSEASHEDFGFTAEEVERYGFNRLRTIISFPIYGLDAKNRQTGAVIGVVNMDTTDTEGYTVLTAKIEKYRRLLIGISDCISRAASN